MGVTHAQRNPHEVTRDFEAALCRYTGAPYAVAVTSCTMALLLAVAWHLRNSANAMAEIEIPRRTYVGVPQSILNAGARVKFREQAWSGAYRLEPLPVWDSARWFTSGLYQLITGKSGGMVCVSFHATKTLGDSQGGAILLDSHEADAWLRRARFDGRTEGIAPKDDTFDMRGWHAYLSPDISSRLLWRLGAMPVHNAPLPNDEYPDLSKHEAFR